MAALIGSLRVSLGIDTAAFTDGLKQAQTKLAGVGRSMKSIGTTMSLSITAPLGVAGGLIIKTAGDFEASLNRIAAATGASADEMGALSTLARDLGKSTTFSAVEAADAIEMLAKNGVSTADIMDGVLKASLDLAAASGADLAGSADLATSTMLNFGKGVGDLGAVVDGVSGVLLESKFGFDDYSQAIAQAGGVAGGLGVTLEDFNAVIAATSASFSSGSDAGTSFKSFLQRLVPQSKAAATAMNELGLEFFNADGSLKGMAEIAGELQQALSGLSEEARSEALTTIFGADAMRTAIGLMDQGAQGVRDLNAAIGEASAAEQAAARTQGWAGAIEQLNGAFDELRLAIADSGLLELATQFVQSVTGIVNKISEANPQLLQFGVIAGGIAAAFGPVMIALGAFVAILGTMAVPVAAVVAGIAALTAAVVTFWPEIVNAHNAIMGFRDAVFQGISEAIEVARQKIVELEQVFVGFRDKMIQVGRDLISGLLSGLQEKWASVKAWFGNLASSIPQWVRDALGIQSPSTVFAEIGRNIMQGLQGGLTSMEGQVQGGVNTMASDLARTFSDVLFGARDFRDALSGLLSSAGSSLLNAGISGLLGGIPGFASGTRFAPGGISLIGERGPELMNVPRGAQITPNHALGSLGGGGAMTINVDVAGARGNQEIMAMVEAGVSRGISAYDAGQQTNFRDRVHMAAANPRFRGRG